MIGLVLAAFASFLPLRYWDQWRAAISTPPGVPGARPGAQPDDLRLPRPGEPVLPLHARHAAAGRAAVPDRRARCVLGGGMLVGYYVLVVLSGNGLRRAARARGARHPGARGPARAVPAGRRRRRRGAQRCSTARPRPRSRWRSAERRAAAGAERARVAREMHDSLGKTLYGIALAARGALAPRRGRGAGRRRRRRATCRRPRRWRPRRRAGLISDLRSDTLDRPARRRAGPLRARVVGPQRDRRRTCRPTASTCRIRARATSSTASCARRWRTSSATPARRRSRCSCATSAPDVVLCDRRRRRRHRRRAATRARCRPTATTG